MAQKNKTCLFLGVGCGLLTLLGLAVVGALGWFGVKTAKQIEEDNKNPIPRAKKVLNYAELPPGYTVDKAFAIPFLMEVVVLEGEKFIESETPQYGRRGFLYFMFIFGGKQDQELRDYFEGKTDDPRVLRRNNINIDAEDGEVLSRSVFEHKGQEFMHMTMRGDVGSQDFAVGDGLSSFLLINCGDKRTRFCMWFGPDPNPDAPAEDVDLTGTVGDPERIKAFIDYFQFCKQEENP